jgi:putative ABC transport system ATP-binding protein
MIELHSLEFHYDQSDFALQIEQLHLQDKEHVALIGPSGCGKTTLLNILAGVVLPDAGTVRVANQSVTQLSDARRRDFRIANLGLVFQNFELLDYLTVRDNILLPLRIGRGLSVTQELCQHAESLAARLDIADKLDRHPPQLSQGERQRVAVCRALLLQPSVILADEPTGNLDPANKFVVLDLLLDHARESGATLLTVTHDRELLDRFDRVLDFSELNSWRPE